MSPLCRLQIHFLLGIFHSDVSMKIAGSSDRGSALWARKMCRQPRKDTSYDFRVASRVGYGAGDEQANLSWSMYAMYSWAHLPPAVFPSRLGNTKANKVSDAIVWNFTNKIFFSSMTQVLQRQFYLHSSCSSPSLCTAVPTGHCTFFPAACFQRDPKS